MPAAVAKKAAPKKSATPITITVPALDKGEIYAGICLAGGTPTHHLVLLPGYNKSVKWEAACTWAKKQGGELPTRQEQSLLFANAKEHIEGGWYWSNETHAANPDYAWMQSFDYGGQGNYHKVSDYRARAVRRVAI